MAWLTPNSATGNRCVLIQLPEEVEWYACLQGAILDLAYSYNWEQYGTLTPAQAAKVFELASNGIDGNCEMISDIRFNENILQVQFCGSDDWVDVGNVMRHSIRQVGGKIEFDLNGDTIFETTIFINPNSGNYDGGLFPVTDTDKLCYVAQKMAEDILDDFQDAMQILDYNTTIVSGSITQIADKLFSSLPAQVATAETALVLAAGIQILYQVSDATLDYIILQAGDPDVKNRVANFIFCALKDSLTTNEEGITEVVNFENNLIDRMSSYYVAINTLGNVDDGYEMDFGEALEGLLGAINAVIAGLACSYVLAEVFFLDAVGLKDDWKTVILGYQQQAVFSDDRDCEGFDCLEELLVNFAGELSPVPYTVVTGSVYEYADEQFALRKTSTGNCGSGLHCLEFVANFEEEETIASIKIFVSCDTVGSSPGEGYNCTFIVMSGATELYNDFTLLNDGEGFQEVNFDITELASSDLTVLVRRGTSGGDVCDFRTTNITFNRAE